ncbi:MAG: hypothetical protein GX457_05815 [Thermotogaceae bacterium]|nr:hypothetical protein [Thermotogaceae bacterium]
MLKEKIVLKERFRRCAERTVLREERDFDLLTSNLCLETNEKSEKSRNEKRREGETRAAGLGFRV